MIIYSIPLQKVSKVYFWLKAFRVYQQSTVKLWQNYDSEKHFLGDNKCILYLLLTHATKEENIFENILAVLLKNNIATICYWTEQRRLTSQQTSFKINVTYSIRCRQNWLVQWREKAILEGAFPLCPRSPPAFHL